MSKFRIDSISENGIEDPKEWAEAFCTTVDYIAQFVNLPPASLKQRDRFKSADVQNRFVEIHRLLNDVRPWFNSDQAAWAWFISEPLKDFGRLTPSEVVQQYNSSGISLLNSWVIEQEMQHYQ